MRKTTIIFFFFLIAFNSSFSQTNSYKTLIGASPYEVASKFLKWYINNRENLLSKKFYDIDTSGDTTKIITVNFDGVRHFKSSLKNTGLVSNFFVGEILENFYKANDFLIAHRIKDGPITDIELKDSLIIDYKLDPILKIEDDVFTAQKLKHINTFIGKSYSISVIHLSPYLDFIFVLGRYKNKWLIDSIIPRIIK